MHTCGILIGTTNYKVQPKLFWFSGDVTGKCGQAKSWRKAAPSRCFELWLWPVADALAQQRIWGCQTRGAACSFLTFSKTKLLDPGDPNQWNNVALDPGVAARAHPSGEPQSKKYQIPRHLNILSYTLRVHNLLKIIKLKLILDHFGFLSFILFKLFSIITFF